MGGRCKCCNSVMEDWEMVAIDPMSGTYSELCACCMSDDFNDQQDVNLEMLSEEDVL